MRHSHTVVVVGLLLMVSGCVPSLHPLYTEEDVVFEPDIVGEWISDDPKALWSFTSRDNKACELVYTDENLKSGSFKVHLVKIGDAMFLDLFPVRSFADECSLHWCHYIPAHTFILVEQIKPKFQIRMFNVDWLTKLLKENPTAIKHERDSTGGDDAGILLTAGPKDLQSFFTEHIKTEDAFMDPIDLEKTVDGLPELMALTARKSHTLRSEMDFLKEVYHPEDASGEFQLPAPKPEAPANGAVFDHYPQHMVFRWQPVAGVKGGIKYLVQVDFGNDPDRWQDGHMMSYLTDKTSMKGKFVGANPGRWRVKVVTGSKASRWCEWQFFRFTR